MKQRLGHRSVAVIALAAIGLAACGGGGGSDEASDDTAAPETEVTVADTEAPDETTAPVQV